MSPTTPTLPVRSTEFGHPEELLPVLEDQHRPFIWEVEYLANAQIIRRALWRVTGVTGTYSRPIEPTDISDSEDVRVTESWFTKDTESPGVVEEKVVNKRTNPDLG